MGANSVDNVLPTYMDLIYVLDHIVLSCLSVLEGLVRYNLEIFVVNKLHEICCRLCCVLPSNITCLCFGKTLLVEDFSV